MMPRVTHVGFNAGRFGERGDMDALTRRLEQQAALGTNVVELNSINLDVVSNCRLIPYRLAAFKKTVSEFDFRYTLHAPGALNLMDKWQKDLQRSAGRASLELAAEGGADTVVIHPGRVPPAEWVKRSEEFLAFEREMLWGLGEYAKEIGVRIAYENMSPSPASLAGKEFSYALDLRALARQVGQVNHPSVVACIDVSHAQQGAYLQGFDVIEAAAELAPHVGHIHFSDSAGPPVSVDVADQGEYMFFGVGDMHAPPGFGEVDYERLAQVLKIREDSTLIIELHGNHYAHSKHESLAAARDFASRINALND